ncbi:MAG: hypothetical protein ABI766_06715 [Gemmatimonadales bacterium]
MPPGIIIAIFARSRQPIEHLELRVRQLPRALHDPGLELLVLRPELPVQRGRRKERPSAERSH